MEIDTRLPNSKQDILRNTELLRVLTYHRVSQPANTPLLNPRMISAEPKSVASQLKILIDNYHVVSMEQVLERIVIGTPLPARSVLITFDDAYADFQDVAWPILKSYRLPVTLFVPTGFPDAPTLGFWWDRLYATFIQTSERQIRVDPLGDLTLSGGKERLASLLRLQNYVKTLNHDQALGLIDTVCKKLGDSQSKGASVLTWDQLRALTKEGVILGAHTRSHPILTQVPLAQARDEIRGSYDDLKRAIGDTLPIFAYPNGNHNDEIITLLKDEGLRVAFTALDGFNHMQNADPLRLHRVNITRKTSPLVFRFRLLQWFAHIDRWRHQKKLMNAQIRAPGLSSQ